MLENPENLAENQKIINTNEIIAEILAKSNILEKVALVVQKITLVFDFNHQIFRRHWSRTSASARWAIDNVNKLSNFSKTKYGTYELWRQKVGSFSDSVKTRDQLELSHPYGSSGLRYPINAPKSAAGRATGGTLRSTIISRTFFHIKVTNQMCFDQFWLNTLETKTLVM